MLAAPVLVGSGKRWSRAKAVGVEGGGGDGVVKEFGADVAVVDERLRGGVVDFADAGEDSLALGEGGDGRDHGFAD